MSANGSLSIYDTLYTLHTYFITLSLRTNRLNWLNRSASDPELWNRAPLGALLTTEIKYAEFMVFKRNT